MGAAAGSTLALALLVCGCVFASLAGPAVSLRLRTEALQQALSRLGALGTAVEVDASWNTFPQFFAGQPTLTESNFSLATSTIGGGLAYSLPIAVGWGGLTTHRMLSPPERRVSRLGTSQSSRLPTVTS